MLEVQAPKQAHLQVHLLVLHEVTQVLQRLRCLLLILRTRILSQECVLKITMATEQLKWISEITLKRLESSHRDFDTINTRSGVVIGFAGLFNTLLIPSWEKLSPCLRYQSGLVWLYLALAMLYHAFRAYQVTDVESIPILRENAETFISIEEEEARRQFLSDVLDAADSMKRINKKKATYLKVAINYLTLQIAMALVVIILSRMFIK